MRGRLGLTAALCLTPLLTACTGAVVMVPRMKPAEVNLSSYNRVAVGDIGGNEGSSLGAHLTEALFSSQRFEVLDRQNLARLMKEQNLAVSGLISDDSAVSVGQLIGAAALVVGDVTAEQYQEQPSAKPGKCSREGKQVDCVKHVLVGTAQVRVSLRLLDTESGQVLAVKNLQGTVRKTRRGDDVPPEPFMQREPWLDDCRRQVAVQFAKVIAPYQERVRVELLGDGDLPELEEGNRLARMGKWTEANARYSAAITRGGSSTEVSPEDVAKAHYNLGMGLGLSGQYDAGIRELERAYALDPDMRYLHAVKRLEGFREDDARLAAQKALPES